MKIRITADINLTADQGIKFDLANFVPKPLLDVLVKNGIVPLILPTLPLQMVPEVLKTVDGVILPGGADVAPLAYHEEPAPQNGANYQPRDDFEFCLTKEAQKKHKPLLGICRGIQVVNLALGGSIYQDLPSQYPGQDFLQHKQKSLGYLPTHTVTLTPDSFLNQSVGKTADVNSRHHQAVKKPALGLKVTATSPDGVIEGLENIDGSIVLVQWHPENLWQDDPAQEKIFTDFFKRIAQG